MNIQSKGDKLKIKLDASERRTVKNFRQLLTNLMLYAPHLAVTDANLSAGVYSHIGEDGVFDPTEPPIAAVAEGRNP